MASALNAQKALKKVSVQNLPRAPRMVLAPNAHRAQARARAMVVAKECVATVASRMLDIK